MDARVIPMQSTEEGIREVVLSFIQILALIVVLLIISGFTLVSCRGCHQLVNKAQKKEIEHVGNSGRI
jgi:hypothetical protein